MTYRKLLSIEVEIEDEVEGDITYSIDFCMTSAPVPAQLYGPPENCYPSEGAEFQLHQIARRGHILGKWYPCVAGEYDHVAEHVQEHCYDEMLEIAQEREN